MRRGGVAGAAAGDLRIGADVHAAAQEGAGGQDDGGSAEPPPLQRLDAEKGPRSFVDHEPARRALHGHDAGVSLE